MSRSWLVLGLIVLTLISAGAGAAEQRRGILLAESEVDESYDPFADYSEFDQNSEEEADINFFRNGRFFTIGLSGGYRFVTDNMSKLYQGGVSYGGFFSYFFDLRFALQFNILFGSHTIDFTSRQGTAARGQADITGMGLSLKYFINTQNVTRGLAALNPYIIGGFSQYWRTTTLSGTEAFAKDTAIGVAVGGGVEWPLLRNKMFCGAQLTYDLVSFRTENSEVVLNGNESTGLYPKGDFINMIATLGVNF